MTQHKNLREECRNVSFVKRFPDSQVNSSALSRREFLVGGLLTSAFLLSMSPVWAKDPVERIKIGFIYPDSGDMEVEAKSLMAGFDLFFDKEGPCPIDIVKKPYDASSNELSVTLDEWIKDPTVRFIVLIADVDGSEKAAKTCAGSRALIFVTNRAVKLVAGEICNPNLFRVSANNYVLSEPLAPWAVKNVGTKVFITGANDPDGNEQCDFFAFGFERAGGAFADRTTSDGSPESIKSIIASIKNSEADCVFAGLKNQAAEDFLKAVSSESPKTIKTVIGPETLTSWQRKNNVGSETILGVPTLTNVINPESIRSKISNLFGSMPISVSRAAEGYDLGQIVNKSAKENFLQVEDFETLLRFVGDLKFDGFRGSFSFDKNQDAVVDSWVTSWEMKSGELSRKVIASLGPSASLDFGCGKVGYPNRPDSSPSQAEGVWDDPPN